ncbi:hypothetical protein CJD36_021560 [Flavipsychrobacter stenotrophus]|uniref:Signal transduction histidine kinase dimerisation/phosphoacceptor domain-containing protein n=1 Tax=Flavipsychrobacter stenotrophus TaxID=2077091 RepID=A0A2S7SQV6_9BACT|nr:tetratricopeptide repeat protein [Flavipsychrobacter stenotrophus]PQJ08995.1 hypothetical protein CJD36_021560 [Flavipsychrobacter stenotrophus]
MKKIVLIIFLLSPRFSFAQPASVAAKVKELSDKLTIASHDTDKVKILILLAYASHTSNAEAGVKYGLDALELATDASYPMGIARSNMALGTNYDAKSDYPAALLSFYTALKVYEQMGFKKGICLANMGIGNIFNEQMDYDRSLEHNFKALKISEELHDKPNTSSICGNIANNYLFKGDNDKALQYYFKGLPYVLELGDKTTIGVYYLNIGNLYSKKTDYSKALAYYARSRSYLDTIDGKSVYSRNLANTADCYIAIANDSVHATAPDSLIPGQRTAILNMAIHYARQAIAFATQVNDVEGVRDGLANLANAQEYIGDYKAALENHKRAAMLKDSIFSQENSLQIAKLANKRDLEMKDKDIKIEHLKSTIFISGMAILVVVVVVVVLKFRSQVKSNKELAYEKEKHLEHIHEQGETLRDIAYIQSHYVRGPVTTILGLSQLFNMDNPEDPHNKELMSGIASVAIKLDETVTNVISKENSIKKRRK